MQSVVGASEAHTADTRRRIAVVMEESDRRAVGSPLAVVRAAHAGREREWTEPTGRRPRRSCSTKMCS